MIWFCCRRRFSRALCLPEEGSADRWSHSEAPRAAAQDYLHHSSTVIQQLLFDLLKVQFNAEHISSNTNPVILRVSEAQRLLMRSLLFTSSFHLLRTTTSNDGLLKDLKSLCSTVGAIHTTCGWSSARFVHSQVELVLSDQRSKKGRNLTSEKLEQGNIWHKVIILFDLDQLMVQTILTLRNAATN